VNSRRGSHSSPGSLCRPRSTHRIRTEIGLAPEDRNRWQRAGRRPCARTCRLQEQPANRRSRRNTRPSAGLQNDFSSDEPESACKPRVSLKPPTIGGPRVRNQSDRMQRNKATAATKNTCKTRVFRKRLKGFEPSTFCMASSCSRLQRAPKSLQICGFLRMSATMAFQELPRNRSGLDKEETMRELLTIRRALGSRSAGPSQ
jgi:hypothetical protein